MSSRNLTLEGIILKKQTLGDNSLFLTFFDKNLGKIKIIVRGGKKNNSHRKGFLELGWYLYAQAYYRPGSEFYYLGRIENSESFWPLLFDLKQASWFFRVLGLVNHGLGWQIPQPVLFDNLLNLLESLYYYLSFSPFIDETKIQLVFHSFETKLIYHLGYWPEKRLKDKKWQQIINFLLNKNPNEILTSNFKGKEKHFLIHLENFLNQLHQILLEYKPISSNFYHSLTNENNH